MLAISSRLYRGTSHPTHGRTLTAEGLLEVIEAVLDVTDAAGRSADTGGHNREVFDDGFEPTCSRALGEVGLEQAYLTGRSGV